MYYVRLIGFLVGIVVTALLCVGEMLLYLLPSGDPGTWLIAILVVSTFAINLTPVITATFSSSIPPGPPELARRAITRTAVFTIVIQFVGLVTLGIVSVVLEVPVWVVAVTIAAAALIDVGCLSAVRSLRHRESQREKLNFPPVDVLSPSFSRRKSQIIVRTFVISAPIVFVLSLALTLLAPDANTPSATVIIFAIGAGVAFGALSAGLAALGANLPVTQALMRAFGTSSRTTQRTINRVVAGGKNDPLDADQMQTARAFGEISLVSIRSVCLQAGLTYLAVGLMQVPAIVDPDSEAGWRVLPVVTLGVMGTALSFSVPLLVRRYRRITHWLGNNPAPTPPAH